MRRRRRNSVLGGDISLLARVIFKAWYKCGRCGQMTSGAHLSGTNVLELAQWTHKKVYFNEICPIKDIPIDKIEKWFRVNES